MDKSIFPDPRSLCGGDFRRRLMRQLLDIPQLARRKDVLLSTDCGADCDDEAVVAYLALSRELHLVGIVSSFTPNVAWPYAETTATNVRNVLKALSLKQAPQVVAGSNRPLLDMQPGDGGGADYIIHASQAYGPNDRLKVVLIGAATDVAAALQRDATLADRIEVVAMAFNSWPQGTDPWNVKNDVWAWQVLLESGVPVTIGAGDICLRHLSVPRERAADLLPGKVGAVLARYFLDWTAANADVVQAMSGKRDQWPIWDLVTVAYLMGHCRSVVYPRPVLQDDTSFTHHSANPVPLPESTTQPNVRWITWIDSAAFWADVAAVLSDADRQG
jgi:inosine-uridine nucleoside N-ribohydrolase